MKGKRIIAVAALITTLLGTTLAFANHDANSIHACTKNDGTVRIVSSAADCKANESAIEWNQQGPPGADGTDGTDGTNGLNGSDGTDGANGVTGWEIVTHVVNVPHLTITSGFATCPEGKKVLGGGYDPVQVFGVLELEASAPVRPDKVQWRVTVTNPSADAVDMTVFATCAYVS